MKQLPILMIVVLVLASSLVHTQTSLSPPADISKQNSYDLLLARLTAGDAKIDYKALRVAYIGSKDASPYGSSVEARRAMNAAVIEKRYDDAIKMADSILKTSYLSPDAHIAKSISYAAQGDTQKAEFHKTVYLGLINSILAVGDGSKPETAYVVISVEEAYAVMKSLGYIVWGQAVTRQGEHTFDLLSGTNEKTQQSVKLYFNLDLPASLLNHPRPDRCKTTIRRSLWACKPEMNVSSID